VLAEYQASLEFLEGQDPYEFEQTQVAILKGQSDEN
jgi:hypothetical protein